MVLQPGAHWSGKVWLIWIWPCWFFVMIRVNTIITRQLAMHCFSISLFLWTVSIYWGNFFCLNPASTWLSTSWIQLRPDNFHRHMNSIEYLLVNVFICVLKAWFYQSAGKDSQHRTNCHGPSATKKKKKKILDLWPDCVNSLNLFSCNFTFIQMSCCTNVSESKLSPKITGPSVCEPDHISFSSHLKDKCFVSFFWL